MARKGSTASMTVDTDDKIIVGRVLDVDDIIAFHGESAAAFEAAFHSVIDGYLPDCAQLGSGTQKTASGRMMLRIALTVHAAALKAAARNGVSLNRWAEPALGAAARESVHPVPAHRHHPPSGCRVEPA